jgi:uncharacterized membrane protein
MFSNLIKKLKNRSGNSLAEFAVTTAMMATLATTAAPKFGSVGDGAKEKKTMANIDKILTVANNYYNQSVSEEGRGRFPGQSKYDSQVGGYDLPDGDMTDQALEYYLDNIIDDIDVYTADNSDFVYVFSQGLGDQDALDGDWMSLSIEGDSTSHQTSVGINAEGAADFVADFGNNGLNSPYIYLVIPGTGSGTDSQAPAILVADVENPAQFHKTLTP